MFLYILEIQYIHLVLCIVSKLVKSSWKTFWKIPVVTRLLTSHTVHKQPVTFVMLPVSRPCCFIPRSGLSLGSHLPPQPFGRPGLWSTTKQPPLFIPAHWKVPGIILTAANLLRLTMNSLRRFITVQEFKETLEILIFFPNETSENEFSFVITRQRTTFENQQFSINNGCQWQRRRLSFCLSLLLDVNLPDRAFLPICLCVLHLQFQTEVVNWVYNRLSRHELWGSCVHLSVRSLSLFSRRIHSNYDDLVTFLFHVRCERIDWLLLAIFSQRLTMWPTIACGDQQLEAHEWRRRAFIKVFYQ